MPYLSESEYYELNREVTIHRNEAYTKGYADGLEAARNTVADAYAGMPMTAVLVVLDNEIKRVRAEYVREVGNEMRGITDENTQ